LPSEAEWENVCRGGKSDTPGSGALGEYAWNFENTTDGKRQLVGRKRPNSLGLYDMLGNVEQWVAGWDENWASRSTRGGNWTDKASELSCSNSADRSARDASEVVGFRVVADPH